MRNSAVVTLLKVSANQHLMLLFLAVRLSLCPYPCPTLSPVFSPRFHSSPLNATYHHTPLWVLTPVWCMPLSSLAGRGRTGTAYQSRRGSFWRWAQPIRSDWVCSNVMSHVSVCVYIYIFLACFSSVCFRATVQSKWGKHSCKPPADTHSYLPFLHVSRPKRGFPHVMRVSVHVACTPIKPIHLNWFKGAVCRNSNWELYYLQYEWGTNSKFFP